MRIDSWILGWCFFAEWYKYTFYSNLHKIFNILCYTVLNGLLFSWHAYPQGIDRKDVRIVCHFNIPKTMESFYQESGRAGRDQLPCRSVLYYGLDDRRRMVLYEKICSFLLKILVWRDGWCSIILQEFILRNAVSRKSQTSSSSKSLSEKSLADFSQVLYFSSAISGNSQKINLHHT